MNYFLFSGRILKLLKYEVILVSIYCVVLTIYSVNWYVLNPFEFVLYTRYFVFPGILLWSVFSCRYHLKIFNNFPLKWLKINDLYETPERINYRVISNSTLLFAITIFLNGLLTSMIIQLIYDSNFILFLHILKTYIVYYLFTFLLAWILGVYIAYLICFFDKVKQIIYIIATLLLFILIAYIDYSKNLNLLVNWRDQFIHPILNFGDLANVTLQKVILFITITLLFLLIIKFGNYFATVFPFAVVFLYFIAIPFIYPNNIEQTLQINDTKLYEKLTEQSNPNRHLDEDWQLESIDFSAEDSTPIKVRINNIHKGEYINFSLNEQFEIAAIISGEKKLEYTREDNLIRVNTEKSTEIEILYKSTLGTSIYPMLEKFTYLPFYSNWYPEKVHINHFELDNIGYIEPNVEVSPCENPYVSAGNSINWKVTKEFDCLSIIHGPFHHFKLDDIDWVVYIPFLTTKYNYSELVNNINKIKEESCKIGDMEGNCLNEKIKSITIAPKSLSTSSESVSDTVERNGHYHFNVNIFTDVGYKPITTHLSELASVQIAYRTVEDNELSVFMGQYIIEILNIESLGHIDFMALQYEIDQEEWIKYKSLNLAGKEQYLQKLLD